MVEMENCFCFAFECVFIMSLSLTQQEKEVLFKVVIVMIEHVNIYFKKVVFSIQVHAFTVSFKKKNGLFLSPSPLCLCFHFHFQTL